MSTTSAVTLYEDDGYRGRSISLGYGKYPTWMAMGMPNDSISSMKVAAFTSVTLFEDENYGGRLRNFNGPINVPNFAAYDNFNDSTSSIIVTRFEPTDTLKMSCCTGATGADQCGEFVPGSATCANVITNYCPAHLTEARCQSWCRQNSTVCDGPVLSYCKSNPNDPFCACVNSPAATKGIINPKCVDRNCINGGYLSSTMQNSNCPSIVTCETKVQLDNSGISLATVVPIQQNCGNTPSSGAVTAPSSGGGSSSTGGGGGTPSTTVVNPPAGSPITNGSVIAGPTGGALLTTLLTQWLRSNMQMILVFLFVVFLGIMYAIWPQSGADDDDGYM